MRILFLAELDPLLAQGHAVHVRRLVEALAARGHEIEVVARDSGGAVAWEPPGPLFRLRRWGVPRVGQILLEAATVGTVRRRLRREPPDVVLARSEALGWSPLFVPRAFPLAVESNASLLAHQGDSRGPRARLVRALEGAVLRRALRVGVVAPELLEHHVRDHAVSRARIFVVPNGAWIPPLLPDAEIATLRRAHDATSQDYVVALVGCASPRIAFDLLLAAVAAEPSARLWVMGEGESLERWKALAASSAAAARVAFHGPLPEEEAARRSQAAHVVVAPYGAGQVARLGADPLKVLFGLACNRPVLASGIGSEPPLEALLCGRNFASDRDAWIEALRAAVVSWRAGGCALPPGAEAGEGAGRRWVAEHRTWTQAAQRWEEELQTLVSPVGASS